MQKIKARTSSRHYLSDMDSDVIAVSVREKQSLQKCIHWNVTVTGQMGEGFMKAFLQWRVVWNFLMAEVKSQPWRPMKMQIHVSIFLEMYFCYFHWEQMWYRNGNKWEIKKNKKGLLYPMELEVGNPVRKYVAWYHDTRHNFLFWFIFMYLECSLIFFFFFF